MEKYTMLALSTAHLTEGTASLLEAGSIKNVTIYPKGEYGWFVHVPELSDLDSFENKDCPKDLMDCMRYARSNGCSWLMFDCDVEEECAPELQKYEW